MQYDEFFERATGNEPYSYQNRLAGETSGRAFETLLIDIPTGLGKTAAVILSWLWNREINKREDWPRRLVYCLPMRTLVEQTSENVKIWLDKLELSEQVSVHVLMGGEDAGDWDIYPERNIILIGTQDMLLSRVLNRGYGLARARWPMHFGLLNNDCLWVLDETQLIGVGVRTSAQMEGLRMAFGTVIGCGTWWVSATLDPRLLATPDYSVTPAKIELLQDDTSKESVRKRVDAVKRLSNLPISLSSDAAKVRTAYVERLAEEVAARHQQGTTTLVILNRVNRARELMRALLRLKKKFALPECILVHSRFRPIEREKLSEKITTKTEKIIVATQAIEAGVDISSRTLITELAPWSSLVQRFGRCNRSGEFNESGGTDIYWIDLLAEDEKNARTLALPYTTDQLNIARKFLSSTDNGAPGHVAKIRTQEAIPEVHILRRKDLIELFDTTPDLSGLDIDVGRYIRDGEERDVQLFWRQIEGDTPSDQIRPMRRELVRVPIAEFQAFAKTNKEKMWFWDVVDGDWKGLRSDQIAPGRVYLTEAGTGGYSAVYGWTGEKEKDGFDVLEIADQARDLRPRDGQDRDDESLSSQSWQTLETHTSAVLAKCDDLLAHFPAAAPWAASLRTAVKWHDVGKAHECFQEFICANRAVPSGMKDPYIAKSPRVSGRQAHHRRPHFRHELASALAWLQSGDEEESDKDLVAYLIATHHGKIRLSLRAMPGETAPPDEGQLYARGVWDGDRLPPSGREPIEGLPSEGIALDLRCVQMGSVSGVASWISRALSLRDSQKLGVLRLPWLELIVRAADARGSI